MRRWLLLLVGVVLLCGLVGLLGQVMRQAERLRELHIRQQGLEQRLYQGPTPIDGQQE